MALSRDSIVAAGLQILADYGLADLTMRRVADSLGVQAGALYYHVPNKQSLLAAVGDEILAGVSLPEVARIDAWLAAWAMALRAQLLAHRDAAELIASTQALGLGIDAAAPARGAAAQAGLAEPDATAQALLHLVLGHVVQEQTRKQMHQLGILGSFDAAESDRSFEWGVRLVVAGIHRTFE